MSGELQPRQPEMVPLAWLLQVLDERTPAGAIPSRFLLALASRKAAVVPGPKGTSAVIEAGEPVYDTNEAAKAWDSLKFGLSRGRVRPGNG